MKTIKIYYDKFADVLTFTRKKGLAADPVAKVNIPDDTERDGDCLVLPDATSACFKRRRVTATELFIRAITQWGDVSIAEYNISSHTFTYYGKHKPGLCLHGFKYPCDQCNYIRQLDRDAGRERTDEEYEKRLTRQVQLPITA